MFHLFYLFYLQVFSNGFGSSLDDGGLQLDGVLQRRAGASDWRSSCRRSSPGEGSLSRRRVLSERLSHRSQLQQRPLHSHTAERLCSPTLVARRILAAPSASLKASLPSAAEGAGPSTCERRYFFVVLRKVGRAHALSPMLGSNDRQNGRGKLCIARRAAAERQPAEQPAAQRASGTASGTASVPRRWRGPFRAGACGACARGKAGVARPRGRRIKIRGPPAASPNFSRRSALPCRF